MKRIILAVFLLFNFQFALAHVVDDIENGVSVNQAVQNAVDACERGSHCHSPEEIASALQAAGIPAVDTATAMSNAGISDSVNITATAYGMETDALIIALADVPIGGVGTGYEGGYSGAGGGGGGGGTGVSDLHLQGVLNA